MRISDWSSGVCSSDLAVVGRLPGERAAVAEAGEHGVWELLVGELGFLQADHVRLRVAQPLFQVRQAHVEGVDVPAGDFHAWFPWKSRRGRSPGLRDPIRPRRSGLRPRRRQRRPTPLDHAPDASEANTPPATSPSRPRSRITAPSPRSRPPNANAPPPATT